MNRAAFILFIMLFISFNAQLSADTGLFFEDNPLVITAGSLMTASRYCGELYEPGERVMTLNPAVTMEASWFFHNGLAAGGKLSYKNTDYRIALANDAYENKKNITNNYVFQGGPCLYWFFKKGNWLPFLGFSAQYSYDEVKFEYDSLFATSGEEGYTSFRIHMLTFTPCLGVTYLIYRTLGLYISYSLDIQKQKYNHYYITGNSPDESFIYYYEYGGRWISGYVHSINIGIKIFL